jgi:hypothetical protein
MLINLGISMLLLILNITTQAQGQSPSGQLITLPSKFFSKVNDKIGKLNKQLSKQTEKYLRRLLKQEEKLKRKLSRIDTTASKQLFANASTRYEQLINNMKMPDSKVGASSGEYLPYLDSLKGSLSFLEKNNDLLQEMKSIGPKVSKSLAGVGELQSRLQHAEQVKQFIRQRKQQLTEALHKYTKLPGSFTKGLQQFNKESFYYAQQVREYKEILNDPDKITQKALTILNKLPPFQEFMKQHSELAGLFGLPAGYGNVANLGGLQTRAQVQSMIQGQLAAAGPGGPQMLQQNLQAAQAQLNKFKDKLNQLGKGSGDIEMPDFKAKSQRTKTFLERLEIGTNLQSVKSNYFFPTTTDLGLSVGYKLSDKSTIGIGGSYKVGWGKDIRNIVVTSQGAGLRSFLDVKLKGSFYASGGFEYNFQPLDTNGISMNTMWTKSALLGVSKVVSLKSKFFKKTKLQLLWDFMSYEQIPKTQPLKFRVGYNF